MAVIDGMQRSGRLRIACEALWHLEDQMDLISWRYGGSNGLCLWQVLRFQVFMAALRQADILEPHQPDLDKSSGSGFVHKFRQKIERYTLTPGRFPSEAQTVFISNARKANGRDPFLEPLFEGYRDQTQAVFDTNSLGQRQKGVFDLDFFSKRARRENRERLEATDPDRRRASEFLVRLGAELGADLGGLFNGADAFGTNYLRMRGAWARYFDACKAERLIAIGSYFRPAPFAGARLVGIDAIDAQHGMTSRYAVGYSWPGEAPQEAAPTGMLFFGQYWIDSVPHPAGLTSVISGSPLIKAVMAKALTESRDVEDPCAPVVVVSQRTVSQILWTFAIALARERPDVPVIYRPHPGESINRYQALLAAEPNPPANLDLSWGSPSIYSMLESARLQIGVYSTTLFEGLALGCPSVVLDAPGAEHMEDVVARGDMPMISTVEEAIALVDTPPKPCNAECYYAPPAPPTDLVAALAADQKKKISS